jgi:hypothetical protein
MKGKGEVQYTVQTKTRSRTKEKDAREWDRTHLDLPERAVIVSQRVLDVVVLVEDDPTWNLFGQSLCDLYYEFEDVWRFTDELGQQNEAKRKVTGKVWREMVERHTDGYDWSHHPTPPQSGS